MLKTDKLGIKENLQFANSIRFISMMGIVWAHVPITNIRYTYDTFDSFLGYAFIRSIFQFAVICFFMVSGYLTKDKIDGKDSFIYFKKRINSTLGPFLFVIVLTFLLQLLLALALHRERLIDILTIKYLFEIIVRSPLWFMVNLYLGLAIFVLFRKYISSLWFGFAFLTVTLGISWLSVYNTHFLISHIYTFVGFVFYLWLGNWFWRHNLIARFKQIPMSVLVVAATVFYILSSLEYYHLYQSNKVSFDSVLRITNQAYSIIVFILFTTLFSDNNSFKALVSRQEGFAIYLYHGFLLSLLIVIEHRVYNRYHLELYSNNFFYLIFIQFAKFLFIYASTLCVVKFLLKYNLGFFCKEDKLLSIYKKNFLNLKEN